jgi:hypothetical protein
MAQVRAELANVSGSLCTSRLRRMAVKLSVTCRFTAAFGQLASNG